MKLPLFSIIIPSYNYAQLVSKAVISSISQKGVSYEVIVINDGSTDNTRAVLETLHQQYPNQFRSIDIKNIGSAAVRNLGIRESCGQFLIFLDADDELLPYALPQLKMAIEEHPNAEVIIGGYLSYSANSKTKTKLPGILSNNKEQCFRAYLIDRKIRLYNGSIAIARHAFNNCLYPEQFRNSEDIPVLSYLIASKECCAIQIPISKAYRHSGSLRNNGDLIIKTGIQIADEIFRSDRLPPSLMKYKSLYIAHRHLEIFRILYRLGNYKEALKHYLSAIKLCKRLFFRFSVNKKFFPLLFKSYFYAQ